MISEPETVLSTSCRSPPTNEVSSVPSETVVKHMINNKIKCIKKMNNCSVIIFVVLSLVIISVLRFRSISPFGSQPEVLYFPKKVTEVKYNYVTEDVARIAVLFTAYNEEKRWVTTNNVLNYYSRTIPSNMMFIVDSSNTGVDPSLIPLNNQAIFEQSNVCKNLYIHPGPTDFEVCALRTAFNLLDFGHATHVFKLTCKYKIIDFTDCLRHVKTTDDIILQYHRDRRGFQNTELLGIRREIFMDVIEKVYATHERDLERKLAKFLSNNMHLYNVRRIRKMHLKAPFIPRSDGSILSTLKSSLL